MCEINQVKLLVTELNLYTHIDTFEFHVGQIIGEYEINVVTENKTTKEKVKVVCSDEKPIKIDYNISKGLS